LGSVVSLGLWDLFLLLLVHSALIDCQLAVLVGLFIVCVNVICLEEEKGYVLATLCQLQTTLFFENDAIFQPQ
jgi:hypothetical protein